MAYIAFASAKGSPGVTTAVAALAAAWPAGRRLLVVEADPAGGDLAVRFDLATEPSLVTLAAAGRRELDPATLLAHTQVAPGDPRHDPDAPRILTAPVSADQTGSALASLGRRLVPVLQATGMDVLVDCGRLDPGSPALDLATEAGLLVMVARPVVAEVHHLTARLAGLSKRAVSLVLVGDRPYPVEEVARTVQAQPLATLPHEDRAAAALSVGHPDAARVLRRSRLLRASRTLAESLATWLGPSHAPIVRGEIGPGPDPRRSPAHARRGGRERGPNQALPPTEAALAALPAGHAPSPTPPRRAALLNGGDDQPPSWDDPVPPDASNDGRSPFPPPGWPDQPPDTGPDHPLRRLTDPTPQEPAGPEPAPPAERPTDTRPPWPDLPLDTGPGHPLQRLTDPTPERPVGPPPGPAGERPSDSRPLWPDLPLDGIADPTPGPVPGPSTGPMGEAPADPSLPWPDLPLDGLADPTPSPAPTPPGERPSDARPLWPELPLDGIADPTAGPAPGPSPGPAPGAPTDPSQPWLDSAPASALGHLAGRGQPWAGPPTPPRGTRAKRPRNRRSKLQPPDGGAGR